MCVPSRWAEVVVGAYIMNMKRELPLPACLSLTQSTTEKYLVISTLVILPTILIDIKHNKVLVEGLILYYALSI